MLDRDQRIHALAGILGDALDVEVDMHSGGGAVVEGRSVPAGAAVQDIVAEAAAEIIVAAAAEQSVVAAAIWPRM